MEAGTERDSVLLGETQVAGAARECTASRDAARRPARESVSPGDADRVGMSFQPAFNARLISEVKKYPSLYNLAKRGSGDTSERMRIWETIASTVDLNCTGEFAKKRWLQLRDRYRKELKTAIRQGFATPVRWCYFSHLSWLDPYLKDNIALAAGDSLSDSMDFTSGVDLAAAFSGIRAEMDDNVLDDHDSPSVIFESSLDRVLAATHRHESVSPALENDDSGPQSVVTSGDEERADSGEIACQEEREQTASEHNDVMQILQAPPNFSIKDQILARTQQQQQATKFIYQQAARNAVDWVNDEDMLYSRIIGLKLKRMQPKKKQKIRAQIMALLEDSSSSSDAEEDGQLPVKRAKIEDLNDLNVLNDINGLSEVKEVVEA